MAEEMTDRAKKLLDQYAFQTRLIQHHVEGVSDNNSLLQLPFDANCINWILGHIISRRQSALDALGSGPLWSGENLARYRTGSEPIVNKEQAIAFSTLLDDLESSLDMLEIALQNASDTVLDCTVVNDRGKKTAAGHLEGFLWHETYHIGQLALLQSFVKFSSSER